MEARPILATVAQRFRLSLESPKETPPVQLVTLRPRDPVPMRLRKRERNSCLNGGLVEVMRRRQAAPRYRTELLRKA
jgi:hypothetical protein